MTLFTFIRNGLYRALAAWWLAIARARVLSNCSWGVNWVVHLFARVSCVWSKELLVTGSTTDLHLQFTFELTSSTSSGWISESHLRITQGIVIVGSPSQSESHLVLPTPCTNYWTGRQWTQKITHAAYSLDLLHLQWLWHCVLISLWSWRGNRLGSVIIGSVGSNLTLQWLIASQFTLHLHWLLSTEDRFSLSRKHCHLCQQKIYLEVKVS